MNTNIYIHILWKHTYIHIQQQGGLFKELRTTCPVEVFRKQGSFFSVRITVVAAPECQVSLTPTQWSKKCLHRPTSHLPASYLLNYPALCFLQGGNCLNMVSHKFLTTPPIIRVGPTQQHSSSPGHRHRDFDCRGNVIISLASKWLEAQIRRRTQLRPALSAIPTQQMNSQKFQRNNKIHSPDPKVLQKVKRSMDVFAELPLGANIFGAQVF